MTKGNESTGNRDGLEHSAWESFLLKERRDWNTAACYGFLLSGEGEVDVQEMKTNWNTALIETFPDPVHNL